MAGAVVIDGGKVLVSDNVAVAKGGNGGGGGGGNGNSGGKGGGHGGGSKGGHSDVAGTGKGRGHDKGHGHGHAKGHAHIDGHEHGRGHGLGHAKGHGQDGENGNGQDSPPGAPSLGGVPASKHGISAAALGSLNAAHASPTAREKAAPNSMVGRIAAFVSAVESNQIDAAAQALAEKANKPITEPVVTEVARHAKVEVSEETAKSIAERAAAIQASESEEPADPAIASGS